MAIIKRIKRLLIGKLNEAQKEGMVVEEHVSIIGGGKLWQ